MDKPTSVLRQEFIDNMVNMINGSKLPMFVMEPILKDLHLTVAKEANRIYQLEKKKYEESLKKDSAKEE